MALGGGTTGLAVAYVVLTAGLFVAQGVVMSVIQAAQLLLPVAVAYALLRRSGRSA